MISKLWETLSHISCLFYILISDTGYVDFNNSTDSVQSFTGFSAKVILSSTVDAKIGFDESSDVSELTIQGGEQPVCIEKTSRSLYVKGVSGSGRLSYISHNLNTGKSDDEIRLEDRMNRRI